MIRIFRVSIPTSVFGLFLAEALLCGLCYLAAAWLLLGAEFPLWFVEEGGWQRTLLVTLTIIIGIYFNDLYTNIRVTSRTLLVSQFCTVVGIALILQALLTYVSRNLVFSRWQMLIGSALILLILPSFRMAWSKIAIGRLGMQRVLLLGANDIVQDVAAQIWAHPEKGMISEGYLETERRPELEKILGPWLGQPDTVFEIATKLKPDLIAVGLAERRGRLPIYPLMDLRLSGYRIEDASVIYETLTGRVSVKSLRPSQLVFHSQLGPNPRILLVKDLLSMIVAVVGILVVAPVMALVALAVLVTSPGPAVYSQIRTGLRGRPFRVYKFRSMYDDAEARTGAVWASKDDPRITPLGKWLRKLRLDELPQLFNVLKGEMHIVGPRPERPEFVKQLTEQIPFYAQRHFVKPGVTGWAQINHKYGDTIEDTVVKLEFDLYYIKHVSPALDLYILFNTVKVMLLSRGSQ